MTLVYWLLCVLIGLLPAVLVYIRDRRKNLPVQWLPALLRFLTCFTTAALLLAPAFPSTKTEEEKPVLIWLQDNSTSMRQALGNDTAAYKAKVKALQSSWGSDYSLVPVSFGSVTGNDTALKYDQRSTNIARALQAVTEQYQDRNIGAVILATDGIYNEGLDPLYAPLSVPVPVYSLALGDSTRPEDISVTRVYANKIVALNSSFEVIADIHAEKLQGTRTTVNLLHNGSSQQQVPLTVDKDRMTATVRFEVKATAKGFRHYSIAIPALEGEQNTTNNRMDFYVEVIDDETKVLIVAAAPHPDVAAIREALEGVPQYKVTLRLGNDIPANTGDYHLIIAHQLPSVTGAALPSGTVPVWYILGRQSNLADFSRRQDMLTVAGPGSTNDALALLNTGFSFFTLPVNIREVMTKLPPLQVPYGNYKAAGDAQVLFRQQIGNVGTNYPLWLFRSSPSPLAVLCGEGLWRWRLYEYKNTRKHEVVDELIRQTVSLLSAKKDNRPFRVFMDKYILNDNETVTLYGALKNDNGELINTPEAKLELADSNGKVLRYTMEKSGNSYRLNAGLLAPGTYTFKGSTVHNGKSYQAEGSFLVESVPLEALRSHADFGMLSQLARQSGGGFFTYATMDHITDSLKHNVTIRPVIHSDKTYTELIDKKWLFFLILLLAAGEWLLRKYWSL